MHWMNPTGAYALFALALILCLYILKQKMEPMEVSSTYLWEKALASMEADRPFQRLKKNLLLFLQLLLALLLALSLMRPMTLGEETGEIAFVFDLSASMQADDGSGTRLEKAVEDARRRVEGLPDGTRVSVLLAGNQVTQPLARANDKAAVSRILEGLRAGNGGADLDGAMSLALALQRELESLEVVLYSDQQVSDVNVTQVSLGGGLENRTVLSVHAGSATAVARVANYGAAAEVSIECYADGVLCDVRSLLLAAGEIASVQFQLPGEAERVEARITEPDALVTDNGRTWVSREVGSTVVVLAGRDNVFLEKALGLRPDIRVTKTTMEEAALIASHSLTVLDGPLPEALPKHGALLLVDPDRYVGSLSEMPGSLTAAHGALSDELNEYLQVAEIQVARWRPVEGGTPVWLANGEPVLAIFEEDGRRVAVMGFDLHDSNLPLLKEFPVFVQRLLAYLVPEPLGAGFEDAQCGGMLSITPQSFAVSAFVRTPSGREVVVPLVGGLLSATDEIGVYTLVQTDGEGNSSETLFTLHIPVSESDVQLATVGMQQAGTVGHGLFYGREWTPWLLMLLLLVTLIEWWVYRRGY